MGALSLLKPSGKAAAYPPLERVKGMAQEGLPRSESMEMIPGPRVLSLLLEKDQVFHRGGHADEVPLVPLHPGGHRLGGSHPCVVEEDVPSLVQQQLHVIEINEDIVEAVP